MIDYDLSEGEIEIYRGKQWVVTNYGMCGFLALSGVSRRFYWLDREQVSEHVPNAHKPSVEYGTVTHLAGKAWVDLEDVIIAVRVACSHYEVDTAGWLNPEIEHARAVRNYKKAAAAVRAELHPDRTIRVQPQLRRTYHGRARCRSRAGQAWHCQPQCGNRALRSLIQ
jgi:hypothetical protein